MGLLHTLSGLLAASLARETQLMKRLPTFRNVSMTLRQLRNEFSVAG